MGDDHSGAEERDPPAEKLDVTPTADKADRWGLADLRAVWAERRAAAREACARIDTTGMTRRPRDPVEHEWLAARGLLGPFDKRWPVPVRELREGDNLEHMATSASVTTLTPPPVDDIVRRIVEAIHPRRIVAFGSWVRDEARADSDIDLMIEWETDARPAARAVAIYELFGLRTWAMDVVVYTPAEVARLRNVHGTLLNVIEHEGRTLYERAA